MDFRDTLNLPDARDTLPMKANLPSLEPEIQAEWDRIAVYHRIQELRAESPTFVLHDGPPYTNSPIHLGTALNKMLKDFVVKSRAMMGYRCPYVPGFDNHGLPVEQSVAKKLAEQKIQLDSAGMVQACRDHAWEYIQVQTQQFKRLGVFGLWEKPYYTMDFRYEAHLVRLFGRLVERDFIYRGLRPTLWSPSARTALADSEIEYKDHVSRAIYVRFKLRHDPNRLFERFENFYTIIWTTTPWTIPGNLAVAFHPQFEYAVVKVGEDHYLVASALLNQLASELGWEQYEVLERMDGINLDHAEFSHPLFNRRSLAVIADYVTAEDGTGVVHTAPSHGREDFLTGAKYELPVPNTVDERGFLTEEAGEFAGTFYEKCDQVVVQRLEEEGALLKSYDYAHSYPYAERDEKPVIFRATEQWFISIDANDLRKRMLAEIEKVRWHPAAGQNRIESMVRNRPDWCISRQRPWGVGIPIFYGAESRKPVLDPVVFELVAVLVEREGLGGWKLRSPEEILPKGYEHPETGETEFIKETDTFDVWFDSGASSLCVLTDEVDPEWGNHWPADVYLEGSDQHRGWFNTSLILGTALMGHAPYREVVTHGFVVDQQGRKQSKRLGNGIDPEEACATYGADVLRYWAAGVDYSHEVPCYDALLRQFGESYRNIRNTLRFLIANAAGLTPEQAEEAKQRRLPLDEWVIEQTELLCAECVGNYRDYNFTGVMTSVHNFCREQLSKVYLDTIKDRMYCDPLTASDRLSSAATCHEIATRLILLVAPVLAHTAEEAMNKLRSVSFAPSDSPTVHAMHFTVPTEERLVEIEASDLQVHFSTIFGVREDVFAAFEAWKGTDGVKDSQDAILTLTRKSDIFARLQGLSGDDLALLFKMSWVELIEGEPAIEFRKSEFLKCERSRLRRPDVMIVDFRGEEVPLSARDRRVLGV